MASLFKNPTDSSFSRIDWLEKHHALKSRLRSELISKIPIGFGDNLLDLGCGTGAWSLLALDKVGIHGTVIGLDADLSSIAFAKKRSSLHYLSRNIHFITGDMSQPPFSTGSFDIVFVFNSLSYVRFPCDTIRQIAKLLKKNGLLVIKETDILSDFYWPNRYDLYSRIIHSVADAGPEQRVGNYNPFFARSISSILDQTSPSTVSISSISFSLMAPSTKEEKNYIRANASMLGEIARRNGAGSFVDDWLLLFDENNSYCLFREKEFLYSMTEMIFYAKFA
jgi:ubiquinone/menaquinone biosynthesis C-methylase UbiE